MGSGFFGFVPFVGLALILVGVAGKIRFGWNIKNRDALMPLGLEILRRTLELISLAAFVFAVYLFASKGWIVIESSI